MLGRVWGSPRIREGGNSCGQRTRCGEWGLQLIYLGSIWSGPLTLGVGQGGLLLRVLPSSVPGEAD